MESKNGGDPAQAPVVGIARGPRHARICPTRAKTGCIWRSFGDPGARCPEHGKGETQADRPYKDPRKRVT